MLVEEVPPTAQLRLVKLANEGHVRICARSEAARLGWVTLAIAETMQRGVLGAHWAAYQQEWLLLLDVPSRGGTAVRSAEVPFLAMFVDRREVECEAWQHLE